MDPLNTDSIKFADEAIFALFKGEPKTGKSIAAHSFPDTYTFLFDIGRMPSVINYHKKNFKYNTFNNLVEVNKQCMEFRKHCPYKTLIVDSLTRFVMLAERCMIEYRMPSQKSDSKTVRAGIPMTEIEDYGGMYRAQVMLTDSLLAIHLEQKVNVIFIAHVIEVTTENLKTKQVIPHRSLVAAGKKAAAVLPVDFNEVYHFYVESSTDPTNHKPRFVAWTVSNGLDWAASALGLPEQLIWTNEDFCKKVQMCLAGKDMWR